MFGSSLKNPPSASNGAYSYTPTDSFASAPARTGAVLSSGVSIIGHVKFSSELLLDGEVEGTIVSNGKLTVGSHATVIGNIEAGSVTIRGAVDGNVFASERCALEAGCSLNGDIKAPRLAVSEDASFIGGATIKAPNDP